MRVLGCCGDARHAGWLASPARCVPSSRWLPRCFATEIRNCRAELTSLRAGMLQSCAAPARPPSAAERPCAGRLQPAPCSWRSVALISESHYLKQSTFLSRLEAEEEAQHGEHPARCRAPAWGRSSSRTRTSALRSATRRGQGCRTVPWAGAAGSACSGAQHLLTARARVRKAPPAERALAKAPGLSRGLKRLKKPRTKQDQPP